MSDIRTIRSTQAWRQSDKTTIRRRRGSPAALPAIRPGRHEPGFDEKAARREWYPGREKQDGWHE